MTAAPSVTSLSQIAPGSRALLGWWRELAGLRPQRLWFAPLLLHRVEALVELAWAHPLDAFQQALLRALSLSPEAGPSPLAELRLEPSVLEQALRDLAGRGLVRAVGPRSWELAPEGRRALGEGGVVEKRRERRGFHFASSCSTAEPAIYLPLLRPGTIVPPPEGWCFDLAVLRQSVGQSREWKARQQFPVEVEGVVGGVMGQTAADWREVIVEQAEQLLLALVQVPTERGASLLGYAVQAEGWALQRESPVLLAILPSRVMAHLAWTYGRPVANSLR